VGFSSNSDHVGTSANPIDPKLGPLQDNGGPTPTEALLPGSPAIGAGDPALLNTLDQRGYNRGTPVDIGAFQTAIANIAPTFAKGSDASATDEEGEDCLLAGPQISRPDLLMRPHSM